jgi:hypothetical protein
VLKCSGKGSRRFVVLLLAFAIAFQLLVICITGRNDEPSPLAFVNEKDCQITSGISVSNCAIKIFSLSGTPPHSPDRRLLLKDLFDFLFANTMLALNLLGELLQPNYLCN